MHQVLRTILKLSFHIFDFLSITAERNLTKLGRKQVLNVIYQVYVFWPTKVDTRPLIGGDICDSFSATAEQNSLTGIKKTTFSANLTFFRDDQITKMAIPASD